MNEICTELDNNGTDYDNHIESMKNIPYAVRHNRMFHGPEWLNINAMQMSYKDVDVKLFQPTTLYDVYLTDELDFGQPLYRMLPHLEIADALEIHPKTFYSMINTPEKCPVLSKKYKIIETGRTSIQWIIGGVSYFSNATAAKAIGVKAPNAMSSAYAQGDYKNRDIIRRHVILDVDCNVLEVLG